MELGNELRAGFVSLSRFHDLYSRRLTSLYHIKLNSVDIVSHLGQTIPVPTIFCSTWKVWFISCLIDWVIHLYYPGLRLRFPASLPRLRRN
jgi:hypothetical protein